MKYIKKKREPTKLATWKKKNRTAGIPPAYSLMPSDIRSSVLKSLLEEQGGICAYTGRRIDESTSHIEHLFPQTHCIKGKEDVLYSNMVACCPAPNTGTLTYGAHKKDCWPSKKELKDFVSPTKSQCEKGFSYSSSGIVSALINGSCYQITIDKLNLNDELLKKMRKIAIQRTYSNKNGSLTKEQLEKRLRALQSTTKTLEPFHFVLEYRLKKTLGQ